MNFKIRDKVCITKDIDTFKNQTGIITGIIFNKDVNNICVTFNLSTKRQDVLYSEKDLKRVI